jgi:hypothetical protein
MYVLMAECRQNCVLVTLLTARRRGGRGGVLLRPSATAAGVAKFARLIVCSAVLCISNVPSLARTFELSCFGSREDWDDVYGHSFDAAPRAKQKGFSPPPLILV